jgi:hypothetical protein
VICNDEIFFCYHCGWSLDIKVLSHVVACKALILIQKGFKRWLKHMQEAVERTGESFQRIGEMIAELSERIQEEERKKKELEKKI